MKRRDFVKIAGASAVALAASDRIGTLLAQSPAGKVMESKFKGLADQVLAEAKRLGCSYADIRFTRNFNGGGVNANGGNAGAGGGGFPGGGPGGGGGRGGGGRGGGRGGGGGFGGGADDAQAGAAGFGVRVIHSGVWGFASSPIVTEDELKRITGMAVTVAKASAIAKKTDVQLCPVPAYQVNWATPIVKDPRTMAQTDKQAYAQSVVDKVMANKEVQSCQVSMQFNGEWKYFASTEGS
jgi:TldD protein